LVEASHNSGHISLELSSPVLGPERLAQAATVFSFLLLFMHGRSLIKISPMFLENCPSMYSCVSKLKIHVGVHRKKIT